jgi:uncharacterized protein YidB (DUF937 family)
LYEVSKIVYINTLKHDNKKGITMSIFDMLGAVLGNTQQQNNQQATNNAPASLVTGVLSMLANKATGGAQSNGIMGLLGSVMGGGSNNTASNLMGMVSGLFGGNNAEAQEQHAQGLNQLNEEAGGLEGLKAKLEQAGLGDKIKSWIGTGENAEISGDEIKQALGGSDNSILNKLAATSGLSTDSAAEGLSKILPNIVNSVTPNGSVPEGGLDFVALAKQFLTK